LAAYAICAVIKAALPLWADEAEGGMSLAARTPVCSADAALCLCVCVSAGQA